MNDYDISKRILDKMKLIKEESEEKEIKDAISITDDAKFGDNVLTGQIEQFKSTVDGGAQFSKANKDDASSNPLIAYPETEDVTFSGMIPRLGNMKFQFKLKTDTGNGCFLWADELILNKENLKVLTKLFGFYQNWCDEWNTSSSDLFSMLKNNKED